mmetsp:Transcript_11208/g.25877  ORF Transcript_11208/g.25877 Transcript_11208/m.25877 type:complete len:319 (+) Transcript_11208:3193-4149(+)
MRRVRAVEMLARTTADDLIHSVVRAFALIVRGSHARTLKKEDTNLGSHDLVDVRELHEGVPAETRRVVVTRGLSVSESLKDRVGIQNLLGEGVLGAGIRAAPHEVVQQVPVGLSLSSTRLAGHHNTLVVLLLTHGDIRLLRDRVSVRPASRLKQLLPLALCHDLSAVNALDGFERVDGDKDVTNVSVDKVLHEAHPRVLEERRLGEEHQLAVIRHIFGGAHHETLCDRENELLGLDCVRCLHRHFVAVDIEDTTLGEEVRTSDSLVLHPHNCSLLHFVFLRDGWRGGSIVPHDKVGAKSRRAIFGDTLDTGRAAPATT